MIPLPRMTTRDLTDFDQRTAAMHESAKKI
jgi:hypothetical protein